MTDLFLGLLVDLDVSLLRLVAQRQVPLAAVGGLRALGGRAGVQRGRAGGARVGGARVVRRAQRRRRLLGAVRGRSHSIKVRNSFRAVAIKCRFRVLNRRRLRGSHNRPDRVMFCRRFVRCHGRVFRSRRSLGFSLRRFRLDSRRRDRFAGGFFRFRRRCCRRICHGCG